MIDNSYPDPESKSNPNCNPDLRNAMRVRPSTIAVTRMRLTGRVMEKMTGKVTEKVTGKVTEKVTERMLETHWVEIATPWMERGGMKARMRWI